MWALRDAAPLTPPPSAASSTGAAESAIIAVDDLNSGAREGLIQNGGVQETDPFRKTSADYGPAATTLPPDATPSLLRLFGMFGARSALVWSGNVPHPPKQDRPFHED
jgi:hypothetical protein